jgi:hypothetical protein
VELAPISRSSASSQTCTTQVSTASATSGVVCRIGTGDIVGSSVRAGLRPAVRMAVGGHPTGRAGRFKTTQSRATTMASMGELDSAAGWQGWSISTRRTLATGPAVHTAGPPHRLPPRVRAQGVHEGDIGYPADQIAAVRRVRLSRSFHVTSSRDAEGSVGSSAWDVGDGSTGSGASVTHSYTSAGSYLARLTVIDNAGTRAGASKPIADCADRPWHQAGQTREGRPVLEGAQRNEHQRLPQRHPERDRPDHRLHGQPQPEGVGHRHEQGVRLSRCELL